MNYSVPYEYMKKKVEIRMTRNVIEIFHESNRIASHARLRGLPNQYSTLTEHMPVNHQKYLDWDGEKFRKWAKRIGPATEMVIESMFNFKTN